MILRFFVQSLKSSLRDLVENEFGLVVELGMAPSEIDRLTTYEFNSYLSLLRRKIDADNEEKKAMIKALGPLAAILSLGKGR